MSGTIADLPDSLMSLRRRVSNSPIDAKMRIHACTNAMVMKTTAAMRQLVQLFQICAREETRLFSSFFSFVSSDTLISLFATDLESKVFSFVN